MSFFTLICEDNLKNKASKNIERLRDIICNHFLLCIRMLRSSIQHIITRPKTDLIAFLLKSRRNSASSSKKLNSSYWHHSSSLPFIYKTISQSFDEQAAVHHDSECLYFRSKSLSIK